MERTRGWAAGLRLSALAALESADPELYLNGWPGRAERKALAAVSETERAGLPQPSGSGIEQLVLAAVAVDRHELDRAQALLDSIRAQGGTGPAVTVRAALVRAQAAERAGDTATARRLVAQALLDARRERLRRPFLDAGAWIRPLLATASLHELAAGWLTPGPPPARRGEQPGPESRPSPLVAVELSGRERDVLERLARMMSTEEIAADLYVSVNTVKTHLKSVYRKLAVSRRSEAVRRARDLRLL